MQRPIRIAALPGSYRHHSLNQALLAAAIDEAPDSVVFDVLDLRELPLYDGDLEREGDPASVRHLKDTIRTADAVLVVSPEYNSGLPGVLKNGIDWSSRGRPDAATAGKPAAMFGASGGRSGTKRAQEHLAVVLSRTGMELVTGAHLQVPTAGEFITDGAVTSDQLREEIRRSLGELIAVAEARRSPLATAV